MNYDRFIDSADVRDFLAQKQSAFSPLEAAFVVWQSRFATLEEKHAAWREITETMPDTEIPYEKWKAPRKSLHAFLRDYIALEERLLNEFYNLDNRAAYNYYEPEYNGTDLLIDHRGIYYDLEACLTDALAAAQATESPFPFWERKGTAVYLYRLDLTNGARLRAGFDFRRKPTSIRPEHDLWVADEDLLYGSFLPLAREEPFPFPFPLPFKKGDILCEQYEYGQFMPWLRVYKGQGTANCFEDLRSTFCTDWQRDLIEPELLRESEALKG